MIDMLVLLLFPALMAYAATSDIVTMTIPNRVSLAALAAFIVVAPLSGMPWDVFGWHLVCGGAILVLGIGLFAGGFVGGGDAKILAAAALWLGFDLLPLYAIATSLIGGVLTLLLLQARAYPWPSLAVRLPFISRMLTPSEGIPYGVALGGAAIAVYPQSPLWHVATGLV